MKEQVQIMDSSATWVPIYIPILNTYTAPHV